MLTKLDSVKVLLQMYDYLCTDLMYIEIFVYLNLFINMLKHFDYVRNKILFLNKEGFILSSCNHLKENLENFNNGNFTENMIKRNKLHVLHVPNNSCLI